MRIRLMGVADDCSVKPNKVLDGIIAAKHAFAALLYIFMCRCPHVTDSAEIARRLGADEEQVADAAQSLQTIGVAAVFDEPSAPSEIDFTSFTYEQAVKCINTDVAFKWLCGEIEKAIGRTLKPNEAPSLYAIYSHLGFPAELTLMLVNHRLHMLSEGKRLSFRDIEREACRWADAGIDTVEKADVYMERRNYQRGAVAETLKLFKIYDRLPSPSEERAITGWLEAGFTPEVMEKAYDITVYKTGSLKWNYFNSIMEKWRQKGLFTLKAIETYDAKPSAKGNTGGAEPRQAGIDDGYAQQVLDYITQKRGGDSET